MHKIIFSYIIAIMYSELHDEEVKINPPGKVEQWYVVEMNPGEVRYNKLIEIRM